MRRLDPFVRSCVLMAVVAAVPALLLAFLYPASGDVPEFTYFAFGYALLLMVAFMAYARSSEVWRTPIAINIPFFFFLGVATLAL